MKLRAIVFTAVCGVILIMVMSACLSVPAATIPGETIADFVLRRDVYRIIAAMERASVGGLDPVVVDTRIVEPQLSRDRAWKEVWTISRGVDRRVDYPLPSHQRGMAAQVSE